MANRKDFIISALIDVVLDWTDDIKLAIQEMVDEGIQPNELLDYFDANTIVEALSDNETPPTIAAINEKEKVDEIFDNADTLPDNSELIEKETNNESDYKSTIKLLEKLKVVYDCEELASEKRITIFDGDKSDEVNEFVMELFFEPNGTFSGYNL